MALVTRTNNFKAVPLDIVGSSSFGRYPKIDAQHTYNMYIARGGNQQFLVNYSGYEIGIDSSFFEDAKEGRAIYTSTKLGVIIAVFKNKVYSIELLFDQKFGRVKSHNIGILGELLTFTGEVFISENNKPQILISDGYSLYVFDPALTKVTYACAQTASTDVISYTSGRALIAGEPVVFTTTTGGITAGETYYVSEESLDTKSFKIATNITDAYNGLNSVDITADGTNTFTTTGTFQRPRLSFKPGHISFHDTYGLCAATHDQFYSPVADNTWRLSSSNNFLMWPDDATTIGTLETKPDKTEAIFRFPSSGNMIFVMGKNVTEAWFDTGQQLFPYQRNNQYNIDYGCVSANSVAQLNNIAVWLAQNEKSGPIIMYSTGNVPQTISTDGISFKLNSLQKPEDCSAFIYRQYGHTIYHINFHTDNFSLFYDFEEQKFYEASDQNMNYYHISGMTFYDNQYFGYSRDRGDVYIVDSRIPYYRQTDADDNVQTYEIPRIRTTSHIRLDSQDPFIVNDIGFTIESGETNYWYYEVTTNATDPFVLVTEGGDFLVTEDGNGLVTDNLDPDSSMTTGYNLVPKVGLSVSRNGGASYGSFYDKDLPSIGERRNRLMWWQGGMSNDLVCKIRFQGYGRIACTNGVVNIRQ